MVRISKDRTGSGGVILGGSGGHADTAAGAQLAIVTTPSTVVDRPRGDERIVAVVQYRDGRVTDVIRSVLEALSLDLFRGS